MAIQITREAWLGLFTQSRNPTGFLSRFFTLKPGGIYDGEKVAIDIKRIGEAVATVITASTGPNENDVNVFTTKEFIPPAYGEGFPLDVNELLARMAGVDPFTAAYAGYNASLMAKMMDGFTTVDDMIQRAVEIQASQILQTGKLDLPDINGDSKYVLDFKPKSSHFPTVATGWSNPASTPLLDLQALAKTIRINGKINCETLIMGEDALNNFIRNTDVQNLLDNRRMEMGLIDPRLTADSGATYIGSIKVGTYVFDIWSYAEIFDAPGSGDPTNYIDANKVVMLSTRTRLDMTAARVPLPLGPDPRVASLLPGRVSSVDNALDVTPNVFVSPNGKQIKGELESRPLLIPVQIDGFGCLTTEP